jgi:hypothetical protein
MIRFYDRSFTGRSPIAFRPERSPVDLPVGQISMQFLRKLKRAGRRFSGKIACAGKFIS